MLLQFNRFAIMTGIASLVIVAVYPFMKRITWWPQVVLGLAFSWGALMGFAVTLGRIDLTALVLYAGSIAWVIGYDTIYAHQDAEDDALIGIKSTARLFGARTHRALVVFYTLAVVLIGVALVLAGARWPAWIGLVAFAAHLVWQIRRLDISDPALCLRVFKSNRDAGLLLFAGLLVGCGDAGGCVTASPCDHATDVFRACRDSLARATANVCDKVTRRANHQKSVQPFAQKYFGCRVGQITRLIPPVYRDKRGDRDRHDRAVGCGGREVMTDERGLCVRRNRVGPTPRCWRQVGGSESFQRRWWQESRSPGRPRISRKAIA